ncbi:hypothetical protein GCM10008174_34280 [Methylopila turkensis]|uniref:Glycosyl transferase family 2 n=2 Tax=Methylopila turkensis TaxID=1437816 RepID=A0A9W6N8R7_9HYPH|nr:hypothetical protein GCM10008174_34280 [Methylopila turkensis]
MQGYMAKKVVFTAVKNEGPFLLEWVAYHIAIGFDKVLIVSNDSDDGTTEILNALAAENVIEHFYHNVRPEESAHGKAAEIINRSGSIATGDWVMWLDGDEFLNVHAGDGTVDALIERIGERQGMLVNWHCFGDSGHATFPGRFISKDFTQSDTRDYGRNRRVKTFFRWIEGQTSFMRNPHRPRIAPEAGLKNASFLNGQGAPLDRKFPTHKDWLNGDQATAPRSLIYCCSKADYGTDLAQVNHYTVRTKDMYRLKKHRGRSHPKVKANGKANTERHNDDFFNEFNRNEAFDDSILRFEQRTAEGIAALMAKDAVRAAHIDSIEKTRQRIALMEADESAPAAAAPVPAPAAPVAGDAPQGESYEQRFLARRKSIMPWNKTPDSELARQREVQAVLAKLAGAVFGKGSYVSPDAYIFTTRFRLGARSWVAGETIIRGDVRIGENSTVNAYSQIAGKVSIGAGVRIASQVSIFGFNHGYADIATPIYKQPISMKGVTIGDGVWIGANVVVTDGCSIGANTIVAAGSVVTKSFGDNLLIAGNPARVIRSRIDAPNVEMLASQ